MADTTRLVLPYLAAGQSQKHVTHNDALRLLDGLVQMAVTNATTSAPPGSPTAGDCYIVASGGSGDWSGWDGDLAMYADGTWYRLTVQNGFRAWDLSQNRILVRKGGAWMDLAQAMGPEVVVAQGALGATTGMGVLEETISGLSGSSVNSTIQIPDRSICLGVSTRTITAITGATSYHCGVSGQNQKFGGSLGISAGSTNKGVIGPEAFYADTAVRLTANGGNFTGGAVRIAIHYLTIGLPGA
ncbi:DUF2793 domain-containing protein [Leisingera daeponensis]|uniref:DUF2793 domain-containing protein n=1 Tax=Leisingera daeponensis TaxID=405746 RepID=UPI001C95690F|nr:DUF2793 domain-containing protein [Leisingera daeponensis]MBY6055374.1 DUF2793 domain-containing protein [Leisingera daeponensis]